MLTLDEALKRNRGIGPGFHMLRHLLSVIILAHHCRVAVFGERFGNSYAKGAAVIGASGHKLTHGQLIVELLRPGLFALVAVFFALSGFLVAGSALRSRSIKIFFANRALRILPALSVEVTLSALILGPLVTSLPLAAYFSDHRFFAYFGNILGNITFVLPGAFLANPWPGMVNANLWTLPAEFWCYLLMLVFLASGALLRPKWFTIGVLGATLLWLAIGFYDPDGYSIRYDATHFTAWYIVLVFFFGVAFFLNAHLVVLSPGLFILSAFGYYILTIANRLGPLSGILLTYCMVYLGNMKFPRFDRLLKPDLSYGIYLYGFPITQTTIYFLLPHLSGLPAIARFVIILPLVIGLTALFSVLSWTYIEKPALSLRKRILPAPPPTDRTATSVG